MLAVALPTAGAALSREAAAKPVIVMKTSNLGKVIATPARLGIYYWNVEKKAGGKIRCTGKCAVDWPPVYVKGAVPKQLPGVMAKLGTIKRGSKRQLTVNGLPAYTYHGDPAGVVLCDNVDGWFAVRA
jgi:predicted lipoprotein with Yx(FWY)xxD motif